MSGRLIEFTFNSQISQARAFSVLGIVLVTDIGKGNPTAPCFACVAFTSSGL
jgi:hypothetical protein